MGGRSDENGQKGNMQDTGELKKKHKRKTKVQKVSLKLYMKLADVE